MENNKVLKEIKSLIKNLYALADKSSTGISIKTMHDCAQIISKLHGFSSWSDLKKNLTSFKKNPDNFKKLKKTLSTPAFTNLKINKNEVFFNKNNINSTPKLIQKKNLVDEILIGKKYIKQLKSTEIVSIRPENTILISSLSEKTFLNPIKKQLKNFGHFCFSLNESISTKNFKLDPWSNIFKEEGIENFFNINEEKNDFISSWISVLRYLHDELNYIPSTKEALDYLTLEGVIKLYDWLKINKQSAAWYFQRHLEKVGYSEMENHYLISADAQIKHWSYIKNEYTSLSNLNELYLKNFFKKQNEDTLWNAICENQNITIGLLDKSDDTFDFYKKISLMEINRVLIKYEKTIIKENYLDYSIWFFCENMELWENEEFNQLMNKDFLIKFLISSGSLSENLDWNNFNQIIFLKCLNLKLTKFLIEKMLEETKIWEENIWYNSMAAVKNISQDEGYLWIREKDNKKIKELCDFKIAKFDIYDMFADE